MKAETDFEICMVNKCFVPEIQNVKSVVVDINTGNNLTIKNVLRSISERGLLTPCISRTQPLDSCLFELFILTYYLKGCRLFMKHPLYSILLDLLQQ